MRSRLLAGVLLTGAAVAAAGVPAVHGAYTDLEGARQLTEDSELGRRAMTLSHLLADEREALVVAATAGDPETLDAALGTEARERTDRAVSQLPDEAGESVHELLTGLPEARELALEGGSTALETYETYTAAIDELDAVFRSVSRSRPERAADPTGDALPDLARAVHASSATRGLLVAGLRAGGGAPELATIAQREAAREEAALADFATTAAPGGLDAYEREVTGEAAAEAEEFIAELADAPYLSTEDQAADEGAVHEALTARTGMQRSVLTSLAAEQAASLDAVREDDTTSLQVTGVVVTLALLLALAVSVQTARSLTRPLATVRLGTRRVGADPAGQEPVKYTGRNDEFAEVVASVNALRARTVALQERASSAVLEAAEAARDSGGLRMERDRLLAEQSDLTARLAALHGAVHGMFAHHAQRLLALVGEQLSIIEGLEEHEADPDRLAVLFSVDHLAARMRRHGENLLLLAGAPPVADLGEALPLIDVARAAVSEIERYELVETAPPPPPARIVGAAARDVSHLLAELLDNATAYSPTGARVRLTARWLESELAFLVEDEGVGLSQGRLAELNARLADPVTPPPGADLAGGGVGIGMGLYTVARLAARHGLRCWLAARQGGGTVAQVVLPGSLVETLSDALTGPYAAPPLPDLSHTAAIPVV
ncbi:nitrate- and nitrite sensing domain-containing protein, partial [Streptomyces sp. SBT349]|uniref:sensor histidine kinase n=1 Tax=Streptomyces sp. SBT349 TaxID=1580539 RepID=UPI00131BBC36